MTRLLQTQRAFERDIKKLKKRHKDLSKLKSIVKLLINGDPIPERFRNHKLVGNYVGHWELHIEPDWLLIYKKTTGVIILERTGTHADLF